MSSNNETFETVNGDTFARQNTRTIEGLTVAGRVHADVAAIIDAHAQHHAGGAYVLYGETEAGLSVKMHDSWADDHQVIVNVYSPTDDVMDGGLDMVQEWPISQAHQALQAFTALLGGSTVTVWAEPHDDPEVAWVINDRDDMRGNFDDLVAQEAVPEGVDFDDYLGTWSQFEMPDELFHGPHAAAVAWLERQIAEHDG